MGSHAVAIDTSSLQSGESGTSKETRWSRRAFLLFFFFFFTFTLSAGVSGILGPSAAIVGPPALHGSFWMTDQTSIHSRLTTIILDFAIKLAILFGQIFRVQLPKNRNRSTELSRRLDYANTDQEIDTSSYRIISGITIVTRKPQVSRQRAFRVAVGADQERLPKVFGIPGRRP